MPSQSIKQTLIAGTLITVLALPGIAQGRKAPEAPGNPKTAKRGNIDIPPALMPEIKRAMKARKQLLQAKMAVLKAAQHLQSEVKKLEASSKTSTGKGPQGKAPSMNSKDRTSFMDRSGFNRGESLQSPDLPRTQHNDANELRADSKTNIKMSETPDGPWTINPTGRPESNKISAGDLGSGYQIVGKVFWACC